MARHKKAQKPEEDEPGVDISSLIDVCFLLLIYFIVTSTIVKKEQDLNMTLPSSAPSDTPPEIRPLLIKLDSNGYVYLSSEGGQEQLVESDPDQRNLPQLTQQLEVYASAARNSSSEPVVQVYVESEARQQRVIDILNALAGVNITKITFTDLIDPA